MGAARTKKVWIRCNKREYSREHVGAVVALQELSRSETAEVRTISLHPRDDAIERTATAIATAKKLMIIRRRLGSGTAMKHLYVPLDVASTFISHLQPARNADRTIRGGESVHAVEEQERVASGVTGDAGDVASALAFAAAGLGAAASDASWATLAFVMAAPKPASFESGSACSERVRMTHEVEYERHHFKGQVHRRLTKGWHGLCLKLGARVANEQLSLRR